MRRWLRRKSGFTLIEAIISIALLSILLLAFTLMVATSSRMNTVSQQRQTQLEHVLGAVYLGSGTDVDVTEEQTSVTITAGSTTCNPTVKTAASAEGDVTLKWYE